MSFDYCRKFRTVYKYLPFKKEKLREMMYSRRLTSDNISQLLIMTMTLTQMGTVPMKTDPVGGSIDAVLPISMHLIIRMLSFL